MEIGNYDQCLAAKDEEIDIRGKFCFTSLKNAVSVLQPTKPSARKREQSFGDVRWSFCVPDQCTGQDVETHLNEFFGIPKDSEIRFQVRETDCHTKAEEPKLETGDWVMM